MDVGIYFDLRNPADGKVPWPRLYGFTLEVCEEAERLGCPSIWLTEHHRFDDGYLPQPLTLAAAIAARTRSARLGTGVVIAPLHHPAELAEQAAVVDIISNGRLDLGLGAGYRPPEFDLYGASMATRYRATDTCAGELRRLWDGVVTPPPVQERLPIWMGYQGPKGAARAGRLGEGLLSANGALWPPYRDALAAAGHDPATGRMAGGLNAWVTDDPDRDWPLIRRHVGAQIDSYLRHMVEGTDQPPPRPVDVDRIRHSPPFRSPLGYFLFGTPEDVALQIKEAVGEAPVETVYLWASIAGMTEDVVMRNVHTICTRLAPLVG
ncbi:MAG TPA: LLM class flavin-dependent oxidoreductase [Acidimicrobiales bacterium]|jgi:alkanesulfonate monooxygenase SsuD/methylene tetrahydromethanopterin reductase-like flavin-dependent oxidoreductase (luciferase family)